MKTIRFILIIVLACLVTGLSAQDQKKEFKPDKNGVYNEVQVMPEFPGGFTALQEFLVKNIQYPEQAKKDSITGKVFVQFIINETGKVTNPKVLKSANPLLDAEAVRVIGTMPDWTPGTVKGEKVKVAFTLPIMFALK
jgi:periplasmic protein TonB